MAMDYWSWHPTLGKPWMQERSMMQDRSSAEVAGVLEPTEVPDKPLRARGLLRLYGTVDPERDAETMDAREYALFCTDYADAMRDFALKCRKKKHRAEQFKQLANRVPTEEDCDSAELLSDKAAVRRDAAEAYVEENPKGAPAASTVGGPPAVDELQTEFAEDPSSCPNRLELLLRYAGHDKTRQRRLESLAGPAEPPWSVCWSSKHRLWFWNSPLLDGGLNGSTWLRPVRKSELRSGVKARVKSQLGENAAQEAKFATELRKALALKTSTELQAYIFDPEQLIRDVQKSVLKGLIKAEVTSQLGESAAQEAKFSAELRKALALKTSTELQAYILDPEQLIRKIRRSLVQKQIIDVGVAKHERLAASAISAISVLFGYDYRLKQNQPREYVAGAEEQPLLSPAGLALDRDNNRLFVSEKHRIREVFLDGRPAKVIAGHDGTEPAGPIAGFEDGDGDKARFNSPSALAFDPVSKLLYVADSGNHAIRAVEETQTGWRVTTIVGTGTPGGFGGPALEYAGGAPLHGQANVIVDEMKKMATLSVGQQSMLSPEEQALLSEVRTTGFRHDALHGGDNTSLEPTLEWRASIEPLYKTESLPKMDGKPIMLPAQIRGTVETTHSGDPRERMLAQSGPSNDEELKKPIKVCIEIRGAKGLEESTPAIDGDQRGYAAVITWGPGASTISGKNGPGNRPDGLRLLRQRMLHPEKGESGHSVGKECRRWCTSLASGPNPMWNEVLHIHVPDGKDLEIVVDVWSAASLCAPQAIALSPAVGRDGSPQSNAQPELLIGCGDTRTPAAAEAQAEIDRCAAALAVLNDEDVLLTRCIEKADFTDDELKSRQAQLKTEQELLRERWRTARARSAGTNSIRVFQPSGDARAAANGTLRSLVRGGEGIVDPCSIVVQRQHSKRRYVVMEGCRHRLVLVQPNGNCVELATVHENSAAVCCTPSDSSMYTIDTCAVKRKGGLEELGRLREAKFHWQWGDENLLPAPSGWHNFDEADRCVIEELYCEYVSGRVGNAHIAQFTMPKDRAEDLEAMHVYRVAETHLKNLHPPVPTDPIVHLIRTYGAVAPSKRGRLLDFETMRTAIDSTIRRSITQHTRVAPRTWSGATPITGIPMGDPVKGKVGGFFSEWVKVQWNDVERDKQLAELIMEYRKTPEHGTVTELQALGLRGLQAEASKVNDEAFRKQVKAILRASLERSPGAERARQGAIRRISKATRSGANVASLTSPDEPDLRTPWIETSSLKVMMPPIDGRRGGQTTLPNVREESASSPRRLGGRVPRAPVSPVERWLLNRIKAGAIPWLEPLTESPEALREFARSLKTKVYQQGKHIILGGQRAPVEQMPMYILTAGSARATGKLDHTPHKYPPEQTVMEYNTLGQAFGELAMLAASSESHYVRAATVTAVQKCTVLVVSRASFMQFVQCDAICMFRVREHEPVQYWGEYKKLQRSDASGHTSRSDTQQKRPSTPVSHLGARPAATTRQAQAQRQTRDRQQAKAKAVTRMWTSGPGGGGPVTALPADLNWRELRRSDKCTMHVVPGSDGLPLRDPRAMLAFDEHTLLVADRWIDEKTRLETGAIWKVDLQMVKLADDLKLVADECFRTKFYKRALDGYRASAAIFSRNEALETMVVKANDLLDKHGEEPGNGPNDEEAT